MNTTASQPRPYRSHRVPACDRCRQRKARCKVTAAGQPCVLCVDRGLSCLFSGTRTSNSRPATAALDHSPLANKRGRATKSASSPRSSFPGTRRLSGSLTERPPASSALLNETSAASTRHESRSATGLGDEASIVIGPMVAEDVQILQRYMTAEPRAGPRSSQPYSVVSNTPGDPMIYLALPRHREGLQLPGDAGHSQREILEQILGPKKQDVLQLYFSHIHPAFPVLDESLILSASDSVSSTLICEIYAISLTFWAFSDGLKHHHCPSEQYFWSLAISALQDDFLGPSISTLYSSMVDLLGRPVGAIQGNITNSGRTMALAHSLGLNRDPRHWRTTSRDKDARVRLFWGCMVLDQWSSFAHGIPPSILRRQYDVPLPTVSVLLTPGKEATQRVRAAECFVQLCRLSQVLGDALPLVYDLSEPSSQTWKDLRRLECSLDEWEQNLPGFLRNDAIQNGESVSGASSLQFGYLSIRMLLCRLSYRVAAHEKGVDAHDIRQYHLMTLRRAATRVSEFICSLKSSHMREFWLSFTGHLLVSTATVLLRCAIDATNAEVAGECKLSLRKFQKRLHLAKSEDDWDLADMFIKRCDEPISRITEPSGPLDSDPEPGAVSGGEDQPLESQQGPSGFGTNFYPEHHFPIGPLNYPWESLWDMLEGP